MNNKKILLILKIFYFLLVMFYLIVLGTVAFTDIYGSEFKEIQKDNYLYIIISAIGVIFIVALVDLIVKEYVVVFSLVNILFLIVIIGSTVYYWYLTKDIEFAKNIPLIIFIVLSFFIFAFDIAIIIIAERKPDYLKFYEGYIGTGKYNRLKDAMDIEDLKRMAKAAYDGVRLTVANNKYSEDFCELILRMEHDVEIKDNLSKEKIGEMYRLIKNYNCKNGRTDKLAKVLASKYDNTQQASAAIKVYQNNLRYKIK